MKTREINQEIVINSTPQKVYEAWMDEKKHTEFTNDIAKFKAKVGSPFSSFSGEAKGKIIELVEFKKIVLTWRYEFDDWPKDIFSTITIKLYPIGKDKTKLVFNQKNVPETHIEDVSQGWKDYYWEPLKEYLSR